jgi:hypothetical protein
MTGIKRCGAQPSFLFNSTLVPSVTFHAMPTYESSDANVALMAVYTGFDYLHTPLPVRSHMLTALSNERRRHGPYERCGSTTKQRLGTKTPLHRPDCLGRIGRTIYNVGRVSSPGEIEKRERARYAATPPPHRALIHKPVGKAGSALTLQDEGRLYFAAVQTSGDGWALERRAADEKLASRELSWAENMEAERIFDMFINVGSTEEEGDVSDDWL